MSSNPQKFFHDRLVLLMVSISTFLTLLGSILILLKVDSGRNEGYIVEYRQNLGISAFKTGEATGVVAFVLFMLVILVMHTSLSYKVYKLHRQLSVTVLGLGIVLLTLAIIISNALLVLR
jgi:hypothetical protein